jgi:hypothetical protein
LGIKRAADVTGPDGGYVQGAPKIRFDNYSYDSYEVGNRLRKTIEHQHKR